MFKKFKIKIYSSLFLSKNVILGCALETKDFNSLLSKFKKLNCEIYRIYKDNIDSHKKFKKKYNVKFEFLTDEKKEAIKAYKVWRKIVYGFNKKCFLIKDKKILNK